MKEDICKYCGQRTQLIKSHIIPKSFYNLKEWERFVGINAKDFSFDKSSYQNGCKEYLLCHKCDEQLGKLDGYAKEFLFKTIPNCPSRTSDTLIKSFIAQKDSYNYSKLHRFFISLVWRISVSSFFPYHLPGNYESLALKILKYEAPEAENLFFPLIYRKNLNHPVDHCVLVTENSGYNQKSVCIKIPSYEIIILPNVDEVQPLSLAKEFKRLFTRKEIAVLEITAPTTLDRILVDKMQGFQKKHKFK